jgi:carboxyl-terminal processing protease
MRANSMRADSIDWVSVRDGALERAAGAHSTADTYGAIRWALLQLGDHHSFFAPPGTAAAGAPVPMDTLRPTGRIRDRIGYVALPAFGSGKIQEQVSYGDVGQGIIRDLDAVGACGWIVDLRSDFGGNPWPMLVAVGPLLGNGRAGSFKSASPTLVPFGYTDGHAWVGRDTLAHTSGSEYKLRSGDAPVAILTDATTASAGEAIAIAFRGSARYRSFGSHTAGVPSANRGFPLPDGAYVVVTEARDVDRRGVVYTEAIEPDESVGGLFAKHAYATFADEVAVAAERWLLSQPACTRGNLSPQ